VTPYIRARGTLSSSSLLPPSRKDFVTNIGACRRPSTPLAMGPWMCSSSVVATHVCRVMKSSEMRGGVNLMGGVWAMGRTMRSYDEEKKTNASSRSMVVLKFCFFFFSLVCNSFGETKHADSCLRARFSIF
jgi:hypothetical protein